MICIIVADEKVKILVFEKVKKRMRIDFFPQYFCVIFVYKKVNIILVDNRVGTFCLIVGKLK